MHFRSPRSHRWEMPSSFDLSVLMLTPLAVVVAGVGFVVKSGWMTAKMFCHIIFALKNYTMPHAHPRSMSHRLSHDASYYDVGFDLAHLGMNPIKKGYKKSYELYGQTSLNAFSGNTQALNSFIMNCNLFSFVYIILPHTRQVADNRSSQQPTYIL